MRGAGISLGEVVFLELVRFDLGAQTVVVAQQPHTMLGLAGSSLYNFV